MSAAAMLPPYATEADFFAIPEDERFHELLSGEIVSKAMPSGRHGRAQFRLSGRVVGYDGPELPDGPGGWRFATEVEVRLFPDLIVRPDVAGWRRDRLARFPESGPVDVAPDWVCEVLSKTNAKRDLWDKMALYHEASISHYWVLDPERRTLRVHRWAPPGYQVTLFATHEQTVRVEPFELLEIQVAELFDDG